MLTIDILFIINEYLNIMDKINIILLNKLIYEFQNKYIKINNNDLKILLKKNRIPKLLINRKEIFFYKYINGNNKYKDILNKLTKKKILKLLLNYELIKMININYPTSNKYAIYVKNELNFYEILCGIKCKNNIKKITINNKIIKFNKYNDNYYFNKIKINNKKNLKIITIPKYEIKYILGHVLDDLRLKLFM